MEKCVWDLSRAPPAGCPLTSPPLPAPQISVDRLEPEIAAAASHCQIVTYNKGLWRTVIFCCRRSKVKCSPLSKGTWLVMIGNSFNLGWVNLLNSGATITFNYIIECVESMLLKCLLKINISTVTEKYLFHGIYGLYWIRRWIEFNVLIEIETLKWMKCSCFDLIATTILFKFGRLDLKA